MRFIGRAAGDAQAGDLGSRAFSTDLMQAGKPAFGLQNVTHGLQYGAVGGSRSPEGRWWRGICLACGVWKTPIPFGQFDPPFAGKR
jgi:hypothetical protein